MSDLDIVNGRYRLEALLGQSGMASVWSAWDLELHRRVALKKLSVRLATDKGSVERFREEARIAAGLHADRRQDGIVQIFDIDEVRDGSTIRPYMVMEYLSGGSLAARLQRHPLSLDEAMDVIRGVLVGLREVHQRGLCHGDVKPSNIMFGPSGTVTLVDFGISRVIGVPSPEGAPARGTARYVAPEQALNEVVGPASDIYSVGVVLFELVTGRFLYAGKGPSDLLTSYLRAKPRDPRDVRSDVPDRLAEIILKAVAKDPTSRFQTAAEMISELDLVPRVPERATPGQARSPQAEPSPPGRVFDLPTQALLSATAGESQPNPAVSNPPAGASGLPTEIPASHASGLLASGSSTGGTGNDESAPSRGERDASQPQSGRDRAGRLSQEGQERPAEGGPDHRHADRVDHQQVGSWAALMLTKYLLDCEGDDRLNYWLVPDLLVVQVPRGTAMPAGGWEPLIRAADRTAARRLVRRLSDANGTRELTLPSVTVKVYEVPDAQPLAMIAGRRAVKDLPNYGVELSSVDIPSPQRLAPELLVQTQQDGQWLTIRTSSLAPGLTFGSGPMSEITYLGPGVGTMSDPAIEVLDMDGEAATVLVRNARGVILHDMPAEWRVMPWIRVRLPRRRYSARSELKVTTGDRLYFPDAEEQVRLEFG